MGGMGVGFQANGGSGNITPLVAPVAPSNSPTNVDESLRGEE